MLSIDSQGKLPPQVRAFAFTCHDGLEEKIRKCQVMQHADRQGSLIFVAWLTIKGYESCILAEHMHWLTQNWINECGILRWDLPAPVHPLINVCCHCAPRGSACRVKPGPTGNIFAYSICFSNPHAWWGFKKRTLQHQPTLQFCVHPGDAWGTLHYPRGDIRLIHMKYRQSTA